MLQNESYRNRRATVAQGNRIEQIERFLTKRLSKEIVRVNFKTTKIKLIRKLGKPKLNAFDRYLRPLLYIMKKESCNEPYFDALRHTIFAPEFSNARSLSFCSVAVDSVD